MATYCVANFHLCTVPFLIITFIGFQKKKKKKNQLYTCDHLIYAQLIHFCLFIYYCAMFCVFDSLGYCKKKKKKKKGDVS